MILGVCGEVPTSCCASRSEFREQPCSEAPDSSIARCWVCAVSQVLPAMHPLHLMDRKLRIEDAKSHADGGDHLCGIWSQWGNLGGNRNHHMDQESTRRAVCRIEMAHHVNPVLLIAHMDPQLFMEFPDRCLFRRLTRFHLSARQRELTPVHAALCSFDQEHLTVEWMHVASAGCGRWTTCTGERRRND